MNIITGGVTAPKGFKAAGIHCGVKDNFTTPVPDKKDLAMVLSDVPCAAAGTYTRNVVKADPVILTKEYLADHKAQGIILDSGNANACAPKGMENAKRMAAAAAAATGLAPQDFAVCSTGIIGVELNITAIEAGVPALVAALADTEQASNDAAHAILTTDLKIKEIAVTTEIGGRHRWCHRQRLRHDPPQHGHHALRRHHRLRHRRSRAPGHAAPYRHQDV